MACSKFGLKWINCFILSTLNSTFWSFALKCFPSTIKCKLARIFKFSYLEEFLKSSVVRGQLIQISVESGPSHEDKAAVSTYLWRIEWTASTKIKTENLPTQIIVNQMEKHINVTTTVRTTSKFVAKTYIYSPSKMEDFMCCVHQEVFQQH